MSVTSQELNLLISVTGTFENSGDPYIGVTGDFDGMGISCGVLQWNIGSNSLQPLVKLGGQPLVVKTMPTKGADMWAACTSSVPQGLAIVRGWQTASVLDPVVKGELQNFLGSPEMRAIQLRRIAGTANSADILATEWAHSLGRTERTLQELVWFFDILTQNGSMKGVGYPQVEAFISSAEMQGAIDTICGWLANATTTWWGHADSTKNAGLWKPLVDSDSIDLFVLSYLRACLSTSMARGVVMNRKGTIALRRGHVNGTMYDFTGKF